MAAGMSLKGELYPEYILAGKVDRISFKKSTLSRKKKIVLIVPFAS